MLKMDRKINMKVKMFSFIFVICSHLIYFKARGSVNLAFEKQANQSSTINPDWSANKAVDGNVNGDMYSYSCGHTDRGHIDAWWQVDLEFISTISRIEMYYRDRYGKRLLGYHLYVSNSSDWTNGILCYQHTGPSMPSTFQNISCLATGRYVTVFNYRNQTHVEWGYESQAYLELCEVEVYGCHLGHFGENCSLNCSTKCKQEGCNPDTGKCPLGCIEGWTGPTCDKICSVGTFGSNCNQNCSVHCMHGLCQPEDGICKEGCEEGWSGKYCDKGCHVGQFGTNCSLNCSTKCEQEGCNPDTGICTSGCIEGWTGPACDKICSVGTFGSNCNQNCSVHCIHGLCQPEDGICKEGCEEGWSGKYCDKGTFGFKCTKECGQCKDNEICNHVDGSCKSGCKQGWLYPLCSECEQGRYGISCSRTLLDTSTYVKDHLYLTPLIIVSTVSGLLLILVIFICCTLLLRTKFVKQERDVASIDDENHRTRSVENIYMEAYEVIKCQKQDNSSFIPCEEQYLAKRFSAESKGLFSVVQDMFDSYKLESNGILSSQPDATHEKETSILKKPNQDIVPETASTKPHSFILQNNPSRVSPTETKVISTREIEQYLEMSNELFIEDNVYVMPTEGHSEIYTNQIENIYEN